MAPLRSQMTSPQWGFLIEGDNHADAGMLQATQ